MNLYSVHRIDKLLIKFICLPTVCKNRCDVSMGQNKGQIIGLHISDTGIRRAGNLAAGNHVLDCNMVPDEHLAFPGNVLRHGAFKHLCQHPPEAVLLVAVKELLLPGLHRWKAPQYQHFRIIIIYRVDRMLHRISFIICLRYIYYTHFSSILQLPLSHQNINKFQYRIFATVTTINPMVK